VIRRRPLLALPFALPFASVALPGCGDQAKASEDAAFDAVDLAKEIVARDVEQVRKGMPEGVKVLAKRMPGDPLGSRLELQTAIKAARENTDTLQIAKSTFFSFAMPDGQVLRSEIDPDRLVDQNILKAFPGLAKALEPNAGLVEAYGQLEALRGVRKGDDLAWVVAHAVPSKEGDKPAGLFLSGWSFRLYARVVQEGVRQKLIERTKNSEKKEIPVVYPYFMKSGGAYGDPDAPDVNAEQLVKLEAGQKAQSADFRTHIEIEKRTFGIAAKKEPLFGDDAAVAVVASVF
jgi:hypothetical protein